MVVTLLYNANDVLAFLLLCQNWNCITKIVMKTIVWHFGKYFQIYSKEISTLESLIELLVV